MPKIVPNFECMLHWINAGFYYVVDLVILDTRLEFEM